MRRPIDVTWLIASAPCALTAAAASRSGLAEASAQRSTWSGGAGVSGEGEAVPNIITMPAPPRAFSAW
ncbi:MAG TPA: hypothetical protein VI316_03400 [Candidatus Dormibacteraeota bacterium]